MCQSCKATISATMKNCRKLPKMKASRLLKSASRFPWCTTMPLFKSVCSSTKQLCWVACWAINHFACSCRFRVCHLCHLLSQLHHHHWYSYNINRSRCSVVQLEGPKSHQLCNNPHSRDLSVLTSVQINRQCRCQSKQRNEKDTGKQNKKNNSFTLNETK